MQLSGYVDMQVFGYHTICSLEILQMGIGHECPSRSSHSINNLTK